MMVCTTIISPVWIYNDDNRRMSVDLMFCTLVDWFPAFSQEFFFREIFTIYTNNSVIYLDFSYNFMVLDLILWEIRLIVVLQVFSSYSFSFSKIWTIGDWRENLRSYFMGSTFSKFFGIEIYFEIFIDFVSYFALNFIRFEWLHIILIRKPNLCINSYWRSVQPMRAMRCTFPSGRQKKHLS